MAVTDSTSAKQQGTDSELAVREVVERFREAYDRRDVDGALELFADDAVLVFAPRAFRGKAEIRHGLEWDARLSPTSETRLSGIEVLATANVAVVESMVQQTADGIGYECPVVTVIELGDDRKITRMSSYYDRLAIMQQVASKSPGLRGGVFRRLVNLSVSQAEKGVEPPETPRENWAITWRWLSGGDPSLVNRLRDAIQLAGVIVTGVVSQRPVQPLGDEARRPLPGDEFVPAKMQFTNGVTIRARPSEIWPWLVQMGGGRAGVYSYDSLDNGGVPSADRIIPELQHVEVGDILPWTPKAEDGFIVRAVEPERALVLGEETGSFTWTLVLEPIDETSTRLITRGRAWYKTLASRLMIGLVFHPIHFGMQRRQLLNLKRRAETMAR
jgi:ketosteroid isomerase-like protein